MILFAIGLFCFNVIGYMVIYQLNRIANTIEDKKRPPG